MRPAFIVPQKCRGIAEDRRTNFALPFCLTAASLTLKNTRKNETFLDVETRSDHLHSCQTLTDAGRDVLEAIQLVILKINDVSESTYLFVYR